VTRTELPGLSARGKVRDIYDLGDHLLIVATDRVSAFDVVLNEPVPGKGELLTRMTRFWLEQLPAAAPHHLDYVVTPQRVPPGYEPYAAQLAGRAMVVRKAQVVPVECVARGYLAGGGWREYQQSGTVSGIALPAGLRLAQRLPEPLFTPSTKAAAGHDEPISFERACELAGRAVMEEARRRTLALYAQAAQHAERRGIIIADTKFEFGRIGAQLVLIDEVLTPDSSRFWPAAEVRVGANPPSFDKQFLRDYLERIGWNKQPPPPPIPAEIIEQTRARYAEAARRLAG
jgi:phosphoribosylaminoimidazole-succinocarboxamide synthase